MTPPKKATPEQIRQRLDKQRERTRQRREQLASEETPEQRRQRLDKISADKRKRLSEETPEQRRKRLEKGKERQRILRNERKKPETPEERRERLDKLKEYRRNKEPETPEERRKRLDKLKERRQRQEPETPEERRKRLDKLKEKRQNEDDVRREKRQFYQLMRKITMTDEEKEERRKKRYLYMEAKRGSRSELSEEERKRKNQRHKLWAESLTGEKKQRHIESLRNALRKSSKKKYERTRQDPEKWEDFKRKQRERYARETPEKRRQRDVINKAKRTLKMHLEEQNASPKETEFQLRQLAERMWRDFYPEGDVPVPGFGTRGRPRKAVADVTAAAGAEIPFVTRENNNLDWSDVHSKLEVRYDDEQEYWSDSCEHSASGSHNGEEPESFILPHSQPSMSSPPMCIIVKEASSAEVPPRCNIFNNDPEFIIPENITSVLSQPSGPPMNVTGKAPAADLTVPTSDQMRVQAILPVTSDTSSWEKVCKVEKEQEGDMQNKMRYTLANRYRRLLVNCDLCQIQVRMNMLDYHMKMDHGINENGKWQCSECPKQNFSSRFLWLAHMKLSHGNTVNMDELLEVAKKPNANITPKEASIIQVTSTSSLPPLESTSVSKQQGDLSLSSPEGREQEKCDKCEQLFAPDYLPIHKDAIHCLKLFRLPCPVCPETFDAGVSVWNHYCNEHLKNSTLQDLDPVPPELRSDATSLPSWKPKVCPPNSIKDSTVCDQCGLTLGSAGALTRHLLSAHGGAEDQPRDYFQCDYCPKQYKQKAILDEHVGRVHQGIDITKCPYCHRELQSPGKLWKHMVTMHPVSSYEAADHCKVSIITCSACGETLLADRQFANHVKSQHPEQSTELLQAAIKEKVSSEKSGEKKRNKITKGLKRPKPSTADGGECPECGQGLTRGLARHRMKVHGVALEENPRLHCPFDGCDFSLTHRPTFLRRHIRQCHTKPLEEKIVSSRIIRVMEAGKLCKVYFCTLCRTYLYDYDQIKAHVVAIHPEIFKDLIPSSSLTSFVCPHCSEKWGSDELFRKHAEEVHPELVWRCPDCNKVVLSLEELDQHFVENHASNNPIVEGATTAKDISREEIKVVEDKKLLYLELRGKPSVNSKKERIARHREEASLRKKVLQKYSQMMTKCEICDKQIVFKLLGAHFQRIHGIKNEEQFECSVCSDKRVYLPSRRAQWLSHMEFDHGQQVNIDELVEEAAKVRSKVHWSKMNVRKSSSRKSTKKPRTTGHDDDSETNDDEEEPEFQSDEESNEISKKKVSGSNSSRTKKVDRSSSKGKASRKKNIKKGLVSESHNDGEEKKKQRNDADKKRKSYQLSEEEEEESSVEIQKHVSTVNTKRRKVDPQTTTGRSNQRKKKSNKKCQDGGNKKSSTSPALPVRVYSTRVQTVKTKNFNPDYDMDDSRTGTGSRQTSKTHHKRHRYSTKKKGKSKVENCNTTGTTGGGPEQCESQGTPPNDNLEREKRLVILLERLTKEQLVRHHFGHHLEHDVWHEDFQDVKVFK